MREINYMVVRCLLIAFIISFTLWLMDDEPAWLQAIIIVLLVPDSYVKFKCKKCKTCIQQP